MGILKKIKKTLKKVAKPAALLGAAYLASKGLKNRKENKAFLETEDCFLPPKPLAASIAAPTGIANLAAFFKPFFNFFNIIFFLQVTSSLSEKLL